MFIKTGSIAILYIDANTSNGWSVTQTLSSGGFEYVIVTLEVILATETDSEIGHFVDVNLEYTDAKKIKAGFFPSCADCKKLIKSY